MLYWGKIEVYMVSQVSTIMANETVVVPSVTLTLDQLLDAVRQLDERGLRQVASVVLEKTHDAALTGLIERLAARVPVDYLSDEELATEVRTVREERASRAQARD